MIFFPELVLNLVWSGIKSSLLLMPSVYLQWPTCFTIPIKVEVVEFIPRAGLRAFEKKVSRATIDLGVVLGEKTWKPTPKTGRGARNWRQRTQIIPLKQRYPFRGPTPTLLHFFFFFFHSLCDIAQVKSDFNRAILLDIVLLLAGYFSR